MKTNFVRSIVVAAVSLSVFGGTILSATSAQAAATSHGDVDGRDFLTWQRGGSPSTSGGDYGTWQSHYGVGH